jgi:hypothetical protein
MERIYRLCVAVDKRGATWDGDKPPVCKALAEWLSSPLCALYKRLGRINDGVGIHR